MKLKQLVYLAAVTLSFGANADSLSVTAGGGLWETSTNGNFQTTSDPVDVDIEDNLFWDDESQGYLFVTLEHFIPILPNVKIIHTSIDQDGSGDTDFDFDGKNFTGEVSNDFSIDTTDLILYYEVLDNIVSLDLGLNIRKLEVDYTISSTGETEKDSVDETVPMLYALVGVSPWPDLVISGELSYIAFDGSSISDFTAKIAYTTNFFVGIEAGYRIQDYEFDDISDNDADITFEGVFAGAYVKF